MAKVTADRVLETTTSTGTGNITLAGAVPGFRSCAGAGAANGDTIDLYIEAVDARGVASGDWECGTYTWGTGGVLTRTTVRASSNGGAAVNFAAGTKRVGSGLLAYMAAIIGVGGLVNTESFTYNSDDSIATSTADGLTKSYAYNSDGSVNTVTFPNNGKTRVETYSYSGGRVSGKTITET